MKINSLIIPQNSYKLSFQSKNNNSIPGEKRTSNVIDLYNSQANKLNGTLKALNISFQGKLIDGIMYSDNALKLGDKMIKPKEARALHKANLDKIQEIKDYKTDSNYTNSRTGIIEAASTLGQNNKIYSACNVDFFSSRWGMPAGMLASCMAMNDFNDSIKAISVTNQNHDRKSLQWLANVSEKLNRTRGGRKLQVVTVKKGANGKDQIYVKTLSDMKGFIPSVLPKIKAKEIAPNPEIKNYKLNSIKVNKIEYTDSAKKAAKKLANEKGIDVNKVIKNLVLTAQDEANKLYSEIIKTNGRYDNAPVTNNRYASIILADNNKVYKAYNTEFFDSGFMMEGMCSEKTALSKAINGGANKALALAMTHNQSYGYLPCAECLGWMSTNRAGKDLLIATIIRDTNGNKTDKVMVKTLEELMPEPYAPSPIVK